jgi:hypothetical protein
MEEQSRSRVAREEWAKRVERWRDSGLTCAEFAAELGVNARTLTYWKWVLGKEAKGEKRTWPGRKARGAQPRAGRAAVTKPASAPAMLSGLIEVQTAPRDGRFELELSGGKRLRVPPSFDAAELRRLLAVLEAP